MAKKKAAKKEELTYDEIKDQIKELKEEKKPHTKTTRSLRMKHKLKSGESPKDKKAKKEYEDANAEIERINSELSELEAKRKELRPATGSRRTKYEYPTVEEDGEEREMTSDEKKRYRAKMRAQAKKEEGGEDEGTEKKAKKSSKKTSSKKAKKGKKGKKKTSKVD